MESSRGLVTESNGVVRVSKRVPAGLGLGSWGVWGAYSGRLNVVMSRGTWVPECFKLQREQYLRCVSLCRFAAPLQFSVACIGRVGEVSSPMPCSAGSAHAAQLLSADVPARPACVPADVCTLRWC